MDPSISCCDLHTRKTHTGSYVFKEGDAELPQQFLMFVVLALVGVAVVTTIMLVNPLCSLLLAAGVGLVVLLLLGELWVLDIKFNQVRVQVDAVMVGREGDGCRVVVWNPYIHNIAPPDKHTHMHTHLSISTQHRCSCVLSMQSHAARCGS